MNILLINPFVERRKIYGNLAAFSPMLPPLGLCYIASYLLQYGHRTKILDLNIANCTNLIKIIRSYEPDVVGVTANTVSFSSAKNVFRIIKSDFPGIITVLGGPHISAIPVETMNECLDIDIGVIGEGEISFKELVDTIGAGQDLSLCKGIAYRKGDTVIRTNPRPLIEDLDILPFPARGLLNKFNKYHHHFLRGSAKSSSIISSRGCPARCSFCTQAVFGARARGHSVGYICEEIKKMQIDFGVDLFSFEDDIFNYRRQRIQEFCRKVLQDNLHIYWGCSIRVDLIDKEDIRLMKKAGCKKIYIGVETFNKKMQQLIGKKVEEHLLIEKLTMMNNYGIKVNASFILGLPTETKEEIMETINNAIRLPIDGAFFCLYTPYPGTALREIAKKNGTVSNRWEDYSNHLTGHAFYPDSIDIRTLDRLFFAAYKMFYLNSKFVRKNYLNVGILKQLINYVLR